MNDYLKVIKDKVDEYMIKSGYGELTFKLEIKEGKVLYVILVKGEERIKIDA
jgi:hypothetical protein